MPMGSVLLALLLLIVSSPLLEQMHNGDVVESVLLSLMLLLALPAMGTQPTSKTHTVPLILLVPALGAKWLNHLWPNAVPPMTYLVPAVLFLLLFVWRLLRFILHAPRVDANVLCAGAAGYLTLGLLWSLAYTLAARISPDAFVFGTGAASGHTMKGFTSMYFSLITLTTVGYGDIVPALGLSRMLAATEAICGTFYMAVLVARLVAMHSSAPPPAGESAKD